MTEAQVAGRQFNHEQLGRLHEVTQQIEKICRSQLRAYLDALAPLFRPRRLLGNHIEGPGKESVLNADQNLTELRELFFQVCERPLDLRKDLPLPLESVPTQIQIHEWEYRHAVQTERERKEINITAPLTWVLAYPTTYSHGMVREMIAGRQERNADSLRSFALRTCLMHQMFARLPELITLFEGLRYRVDVRKLSELGQLPLITVSAPIPTLLPSDEVLLIAATYSGRSGFVEIVDPEQAVHIRDPLQEQVRQVLEQHHLSVPG